MRVFAMVAAMMTAGICAAGSVTMITDLEADTAKSVTGAQSNVLALAAAHTNRTDNPHGVTAAQIGALTSETDAAALGAVASYAATNQVTRLHDTQSERYFKTLENGTGTVWQITGPFTNTLSVTLSEDFLALNGELRPAWTNHTFPVVDGVWIGTTSAVSPYAVIGYSDFDAMWADYTGGGILEPANANAQGTATLIPEYTYYTTNVSSRFATDAAMTNINATLNACYIAISNQVEGVRDDVDALPAALKPYTLTRYGDLATTNTAGFAAFATTNRASVTTLITDPTEGQLLAQFRYDITNTVYGVSTWSGYVGSGLGTPASLVYANLKYYSASDALIASNRGANVSMAASGAISNIVASVPLPYTVTNGYMVAELYSAVSSTKDLTVRTGGSDTNTLTLSARPLNYATVAEFAWTSGVLNGTNGTYRASGTNVYWILTP